MNHSIEIPKHQTEISVVIPVYGASELISLLCRRLRKSLDCLFDQYEIILVFDVSEDDGWSEICQACKKDSRVKGIELSRNFGQHYAITAGLKYAKGEWVVVMDCDLQDQPEEIPRLYKTAKHGNYDIVTANRAERKDTWLKRISSRYFYLIFSYLTDSKQDASIANFGIYHNRVIKSILLMADQVRYFPTMVQWIGFKKTSIPVSHSERLEGHSAYNFRKLLSLAFDNIIAFSEKPLYLVIKVGMFISSVSAFLGIFYVVLYIRGKIEVSGYTSLIISIWFLSGLVIFILGVLGIYLGKIFNQTKGRPTYIVRSTVNINES